MNVRTRHHYPNDAVPVGHRYAEILSQQPGALNARTANEVVFCCTAIQMEDLQADIILGLPWLVEHQAVIDI